MVGRVGRQAELREDARHVLLDRAQGDEEPLRDRLVRAALGHQLEHLALARRQLGERVVLAAAADELRDDLGVERRAALADAPHRRGELLHVGDPVLEQVADALGARRRAGRARSPASTYCERTSTPVLGMLLADLPAPRAAPRRCGSAASGCRRSRRPACTSAPSASARRRCRPARRPRSRRPRAAARSPRAAGPSRRRARPRILPGFLRLDPKRREASAEAGRDDLEEPLGLRQPAQLVLAEVLAARRCRPARRASGSDTRIWPPWPACEIRAARCTSRPT